jgi:hypothetical protein
MCTGVEIALIAGAAVSTGTALYQANQASKMADQQEAQAAIDARNAAGAAELQAASIRKAASRQRAEARASLAASGVTVGEGTAEQIDTDIAVRGEQDALAAIYEGTARSGQIRASGGMAAQRSRNAATAGYINAGTSALGAYSTVAKGWNVPAVNDNGYSQGVGSAYNGRRAGV